MGLSAPALMGGALFRIPTEGGNLAIFTSSKQLEDRVADNLRGHDITESEGLLAGQDFGIVTDIETGPNGNLFVVSLDKGSIFEISKS
jgi:hypothetical protein